MSTASQNQSQTESLLEGGSLLDELLSSTPLAADADSLSLAKQGVGAFIAELLKSPDAKVDKAAVDAMIAELDSRLSGQVN